MSPTRYLISAALLCSLSGCSSNDNDGFDSRVSGDSSVDSSVDLMSGDGSATPDSSVDAGPSGSISIYVEGDYAQKTFNDGLASQTPSEYQIAIARYETLTAADDPSPVLCFDHGANPYVVDVSKDNLVGSCTTQEVPTGTYTHGRTKVAWSRYTVDGVFHDLGQHLPGKLTFFRAYSDVSYGGKQYAAGTGTITFSGIVTVEIPFTYGPLPGVPGVKFETIGGEFFMTFAYTKPLPIVQADTKERWARFHWEVKDSFRWTDQPTTGFQPDVWDVTPQVASSEPVLVHGVSGYHVTSSID